MLMIIIIRHASSSPKQILRDSGESQPFGSVEISTDPLSQGSESSRCGAPQEPAERPEQFSTPTHAIDRFQGTASAFDVAFCGSTATSKKRSRQRQTSSLDEALHGLARWSRFVVISKDHSTTPQPAPLISSRYKHVAACIEFSSALGARRVTSAGSVPWTVWRCQPQNVAGTAEQARFRPFPGAFARSKDHNSVVDKLSSEQYGDIPGYRFPLTTIVFLGVWSEHDRGKPSPDDVIPVDGAELEELENSHAVM